MAVQDELRQLASQIAVAQQAKTRAEIELDNAKAKRDETIKALKEEFGVSSGAEIKAKIEELETQLADEVAAVRTALEEAGA